MITQALLLAIVMFITKFLDWGWANIQIRPIVIGPLVGLVLGDMTTGIILGATLEAVFMGTFSVGGSVPSDIAAASVFGTGFGIILHQSAAQAVALAVPIGLLSVLLFNIVCLIFNFVVAYEDKKIEAHNDKAFTRARFFAMIFYPLVYAIMTFVVILVGSNSISAFMAALPDSVNRMLTVMAQVLPALGFAILVKSMWDREIFPFFFVGFILAAYLKMDTMSIAVLGGAFAVFYIMNDFKKRKEFDALKAAGSAKPVNGKNDEMEDFLS
ncbi:PTS sugar transporter subunit IIC [Sporolactobacillus shoreicorticis]|uniref:PTS mannose/fructose/sorbose/N-acetylgalactosamine transporter subunit IIC n=1 Tax=Sporolactobacillus shoreicorticis TaxID=1923877 RepID=A0ABW5S131_9BACL|nr:PTS sugar transporter subunit IIC [Sporolactobacillus shoreicorticis]MCO7124680.1 PTS sugar transporter subunit IIC [Sporolactobacillus shoreicorticis]